MKIDNLVLPNIYQRKETGIYYFKKIINSNLSRKSLKTKDPFEALKIVKKWNEDFLLEKINRKKQNSFQKSKTDQKNLIIDSDRPTIIQAFNNYLRVCENKNESKERMNGKQHFKNIILSNKWTWKDLTHEKILDLQDHIKKEYKPHTAYKKMCYFRSFLNYCIEQGFFAYNEYKRIKFMSEPPKTKPRTKITMDDLMRIKYHLNDTCDFDFALFLETLSITASQVGEIQFLKIEQIDYENSQLNIFETKKRKTKPVSVPKDLLDRLIHLMHLTESDEGYIFHGSMRDKAFYTRKFKLIKDKLELNPLYEMRMTKHTSISYVAQNFGLAVA
ncbi:MAG: hypothetical protein ACRCV0_01380 [Brevinema sp.]